MNSVWCSNTVQQHRTAAAGQMAKYKLKGASMQLSVSMKSWYEINFMRLISHIVMAQNGKLSVSLQNMT